MSYTNLIERLRPNFSKADFEALGAYLVFYRKHRLALSQQLREKLLTHPIFAEIIKNQDEATQQKEDQLSYDLQEAAIMRNEWEPYTEHLMMQGHIYGQMGLAFNDWYSVVSLFRDLMHPYLMEELSNDLPRLSAVWAGTNKLMDYAMSAIAAAYIEAKNRNIEEEKTKTQEALEALQKLQERFKLAVEGSSAGLWDWDILTNEVFYAPRFRALLGFQGINDFPDQFSSFENVLHPQDRPWVFQRIDEALKNDAPYDVTYRLRTKQGAYRWFLARGKVLRDEQGTPYRMAGSIADVTAAKAAEEEIKKLNATLEQKVEDRTADLRATNEELESFSYTVSHDLRAPLRAIDGFSKVLLSKLNGQLDTDQTHYLNVIIENVGRMGHLIDDLLSFSRMSRREKREVTFDTEQLINEVFKELMQIDHYKKASLKVIQPLPKMFADRDMMKHVFSNLLGNAVKFSIERDQPAIEVGSRTDHDHLVYYVKDNGVGFDMNYAKKLFGIFQRLHSDDEFEGTGVGLAIVQRIVHRHGGQVWAEAEEDKGATFYFSIPKKEKNNDKG